MTYQRGFAYRTLILFLIVAAVLLIGIRYQLGTFIKHTPGTANGLSAKLLCSGFFVSNRKEQDIIEQDIKAANLLAPFSEYNIDTEKQEASASLFGFATQTARYTPGYGCTLYQNTAPQFKEKELVDQPGFEWERSEQNLAIQTLLERILAENKDNPKIDTRALIVVKDGHIIGEVYARGYDAETRFLSWSMAKSVTGTLMGIYLHQQRIPVDTSLDYREWQFDERRTITLHHLLTMTSGLSSIETYRPGDNATQMLFFENDMAAYARSARSAAEPGTTFNYSSASTNILSGWLKEELGGAEAFQEFAWNKLFDPAGMDSAVFEPDASGTPVGSSYLYMSAPDWAKFGELYLERGMLNGKQIVPKDWIEYATTPVEAAPMREYGAHFWLNVGRDGAHLLPDGSSDTVVASGHNGQYLVIVPSQGLVFVRLGWTNTKDGFDLNRHLANIVATLKATY
ncbi:MAG: hypothetical protein CSA53_01685 [Gammaproteobacteria bacterium]|nr:MAG: hypothetical protein CSA53_01685 [Gammaproteobacteria bacterium]